jgi:hypothetical protein
MTQQSAKSFGATAQASPCDHVETVGGRIRQLLVVSVARFDERTHARASLELSGAER